MAAKIDLKDRVVGKLKVIKEVPKEERPTQNHGNYWECECECGNIVKVPASYLTGNGNYTQQSCGCDRKRKAFKVTSGVDLDDEYLLKFQKDFEKYLLIHKALVRTSGQNLQYYNQNIVQWRKENSRINLLPAIPYNKQHALPKSWLPVLFRRLHRICCWYS